MGGNVERHIGDDDRDGAAIEALQPGGNGMTHAARDGGDHVAVFGADGIECDLTGMIAKEPVTLENVPKKHVRYLNVYKTPDGEITWLKESRARADAVAVAVNGRIACVRVEFEEGQYDD